jgi:cytochrome c oxidase assembly factor CtaG
VVSLLAALASPLDALSADLFAAHMIQHLLLILVAAPIVALSEPLAAVAWGLPADGRRGLTRLTSLMVVGPAIAFGLHSVAVWVWHLPGLYEAALDNQAVHAVEHLSFLATALLFWSTLLRGRSGAAVLYVFGMAVQSTLLGGLLTFARGPWYTSHLASSARWGLTPLEDQQLAGLIMWVPGGLIYAVVALALFGRWLKGDEAPPRAARTPARR